MFNICSDCLKFFTFLLSIIICVLILSYLHAPGDDSLPPFKTSYYDSIKSFKFSYDTVKEPDWNNTDVLEKHLSDVYNQVEYKI